MPENETHLSFEPPRSMFGVWIGFVLLFAVFGTFAWVVIGAMPRGDDYEATRAKARVEKLKTVREEANGALNGYAWVDKAKGTIRIPIERSMEISVAELAAKRPAPAGPIATPAPSPGLQATAPGAATPAPAASPATPNESPKPSSIGGLNSEGHGQPAAAANPPNAAPNAEPGPSATPAASPPAPAAEPRPNPSAPQATPVQTSAGTPIPLPGKTP